MRKLLLLGLALVASLVCTSCVSMSLPKSAQVSPPPSGSGPPVPLEANRAIDRGLVDTWELLYLIDEKGEENRPVEGTRTLIEFTDKGQVIINRLSREGGSETKTKTGRYTVQNDQILVTDDLGNNAEWPYQITADSLIIVMSKEKKKFYWRRFR